MSVDGTERLAKLIELNKVDSALVNIRNERNEMASVISALTDELKEKEVQLEGREQAFTAKKDSHSKEEKVLKEERERLVGRRKQLSSIVDYKTQQSANREIEHASKQLDKREEAIIGMLDEISALEENYNVLKSEVDSLKEKLEKEQNDAEGAYAAFEERENENLAKREAAAKDIPPEWLNTYDKILERYPSDAIVKVENSQCTGCFMQVGPQIPVQISRAENLVKCPGCSRALYIEELIAGSSSE